MDPPTSQSPITTALSTQVTSVSTSSTPSFQSISSTFGSGYPKEFPRASKKEFQKPSSAHLQDEGPSHPFASMGSASIGFSFAKAFQKEKDQSPVAERKLDISLGKECQKSDLAAGSGKPESPFSFVKTLQRTKDDIHGRTGDVSAKSHSSPKSRLPERSRHMHSTKRRPSKSSLFSKALADVSSSHQKSPRQETRRRGNTISEPRVRHTSEIQDITTIICINVPDELNKKEMLLGHFERFGNVTRIKCNLQKQRTVIEFQDHKSALAAKQKGGKVAGRTLEIYWSEKASKRPMPMKDNTFSSEVDEELKAMSGSIEEPRLLTRPEELTESKGSGSSKKSQRKPPVKPTSTFSSSTDISKKPIPKTTLASSTAPIKRKPETSSQPSLLKKAEASTSSKETVIATDVSEESLLLLLSSPASTVTEKFYVLDARDKLMRLKQHKQSDIKFAKAAVGVCPDMCPEKERYCRSFKCGLSIFELKKLNNCQMPDHSAMVKEYSRSSADQEEPLPHELRPSYVLVSTMNHLLCNVINALDEGSASAGDWYDFIWNRTRAIRKDITQQHMCDLTSVELVEKCARFHIHCSAALCEEDMAVFDFKINNENLTKCLQTLRHFYHDLGVKGIFCPNEAEFRCYDVLINLNEGDILREVQKLHPRIWDSPEIKFAIKTFSALNSNNYVQFFRLVQEACYLNSCILHRYFTQVRSQAVMVVLKAFCIPNHSGLYPIEDFIRVLAFDDETEATNFCKRFGLETQDRHVVLNRSMLNPPSGMPYMQRSKKLVESKKTCSLAEVINAGPLPQNPLLSYTPHSSFDSQGYLKKEAYDAGDQISKVMKQALSHREDSSIVLDVSNVPEIQHDETDFLGQYKDISDIEEEDSLLREEKETSYEELPYSDDVGKNIVEDFTEEVIQSEIRTISADYVRLQKLSQAVSNSLLEELLTEFLCEISQEVVMAERNFLAEKARKEAEERRINNMMRDRVVATIAEELTEEVLMDELCATAKDELRKFTEEFITNMSIMVCHDLLDEMVSEELQTLAEQVFHQEVLMYEKMMKMIEKHIQKKLTKRYFKRWKNFYIARRQLKQARLLFPPCPPLFPKQEIGVSLRKRKPPLELTFTSNKRTSLCLDAKLCTNLLEEEVAWLPLPLKNIVKTFLAKKCTECHQTSLRWTLMVIFPIISPPSSNQIQNWIQRKFSEKRHPNVDLKNKVKLSF